MASNHLQSLLQNATDKHSVIQHLRDTGDPQHLFYQTLLELSTLNAGENRLKLIVIANQSNNAWTELMFHSVHGMRHVILLKWEDNSTGWDDSFKMEARDFLLELGLGVAHDRRALLPKPVAAACLAAASVFWKRFWPGNNKVSRNENSLHTQTNSLKLNNAEHLFGFLESILLSANERVEEVIPGCMTSDEACCCFLETLIGEFNGSSTTGISLGLSLEYHSERHHLFEKNQNLEVCLRIAMSALSTTVVSPLISYLDNQANLSNESISVQLLKRSISVSKLCVEVLSWDFGGSKVWDSEASFSFNQISGSLEKINPPFSWRQYLIQPDFLRAIFYVYGCIRRYSSSSTCNNSNINECAELMHYFRQLLLLLASISGEKIFVDESQKAAYASFLLDGCLSILSSNEESHSVMLESETVDFTRMMLNLCYNFKVKTLGSLPHFQNFLTCMAKVGHDLLAQNLSDCEYVKGDIEMVEGYEWREEAFTNILDAIVSLTDDVLLMMHGHGGEAKDYISTFASTCSSLYASYISYRIKISKLDEMYQVMNETELDDIREDIFAAGLEEQMKSGASLGRISLDSSIALVNNMMQDCLPRIYSLFSSTIGIEITAEAAALLEEVRLIILCANYLLTDDCSVGETPSIPEAIIYACHKNNATCASMTTLISSFMNLANEQASGISVKPSDPRLSPLIGQTLLTFLKRWTPAYLLPEYDNYERSFCGSGILNMWIDKDQASPIVDFCLNLCTHYFCYWPHENSVQCGATDVLISLSRRRRLREIMISSPSFDPLATLQIIGMPITHISNIPSSDSDAISIEKVKGFSRLPYSSRGRVLSSIVSASSGESEKSVAVFSQCLKTLELTFSNLVESLKTMNQSNQPFLLEAAIMCVELYAGVVRSPDVSNNTRITEFTSRSLPHLVGLMNHFSDDLVLCENLLSLFRDFAEHYIFSICDAECLVLFNTSAELLKSYSLRHCTKGRMKSSVEENQDYNDILACIQLLIHLSSKDFLDIANNVESGIKTVDVTKVVFFGLEQMIHLMNHGLLQYPPLCSHFFYLVSSMIDCYDEQFCALPGDLFKIIVETLFFGMCHSDVLVAKSSLRSLSNIIKLHIRKRSLDQQIAYFPNLINECNAKLFKSVVFEPIIWDRLDAAGQTVLPLIAVDVNAFEGIVRHLCEQLDKEEKKLRLASAFRTLVRPEIVANATSNGKLGRTNRMAFKKLFEAFVKEIHSFLILK